MLKVGDKITICAICLKALTKEEADIDSMPCTTKGHVIVTMVCEQAPDPPVYRRLRRGVWR